MLACIVMIWSIIGIVCCQPSTEDKYPPSRRRVVVDLDNTQETTPSTCEVPSKNVLFLCYCYDSTETKKFEDFSDPKVTSMYCQCPTTDQSVIFIDESGRDADPYSKDVQFPIPPNLDFLRIRNCHKVTFRTGGLGNLIVDEVNRLELRESMMSGTFFNVTVNRGESLPGTILYSHNKQLSESSSGNSVEFNNVNLNNNVGPILKNIRLTSLSIKKSVIHQGAFNKILDEVTIKHLHLSNNKIRSMDELGLDYKKIENIEIVNNNIESFCSGPQTSCFLPNNGMEVVGNLVECTCKPERCPEGSTSNIQTCSKNILENTLCSENELSKHKASLYDIVKHMSVNSSQVATSCNAINSNIQSIWKHTAPENSDKGIFDHDSISGMSIPDVIQLILIVASLLVLGIFLIVLLFKFQCKREKKRRNSSYIPKQEDREEEGVPIEDADGRDDPTTEGNTYSTTAL